MIKKLAAPAWAILEYGWYPLLVFITTPFLLRALGAEGFGYWMLLTATVGFGSVLNTGTGAATIKQVSANLGRAEGGDVKDIINTSLTIALVGGGLLATLIFLVFGVAGNVLFAKMGDQSLVFLTGGVAAILVWIEQIDNVFASVLKGAEKFGHAASLEIASKTAQILGAVVVVSIWGRVAALYVVLVIVALVRLAAKIWFVGHLFGVTLLRPRFTNNSQTLYFAKWGWLQGVGGLLFGVADRMLVGSFLGAASLAHYSIATQLAMQIHAFSAAGFSVIFPKISRKLEVDATFSLWRITELAVAGNFIVSSILALSLLLFGKQILIFWLGATEAAACADALWYLAIAYWLLAINVAPHFILLGVGKVRFVALSNIFAGLVSLVIMCLLLQLYGMVGVGIARIVYGATILVNFVALLEHFWNVNGKNDK